MISGGGDSEGDTADVEDTGIGASGDFYGSEWGDYSEEIFADRGVFERGAAAGGCGGEDVRKVVLYL